VGSQPPLIETVSPPRMIAQHPTDLFIVPPRRNHKPAGGFVDRRAREEAFGDSPLAATPWQAYKTPEASRDKVLPLLGRLGSLRCQRMIVQGLIGRRFKRPDAHLPHKASEAHKKGHAQRWPPVQTNRLIV